MMKIKSREKCESQQPKVKSIPDSPGVHSDVVSLGSRDGPAPLPAHSSASELATPIFAMTHTILFSH